MGTNSIISESFKHRSSFELYPTGSDDAMYAVAEVVSSWILGKEREWDGSPIADDIERWGADVLLRGYNEPKAYNGGLYTEDRWPALACAALAGRSAGIPEAWAVEYDEPDANHPGRRWHTCVGLERLEDGACRVNTSVSLVILDGMEDAAGAVVTSTPRFVRDILRLDGFEARVGDTPVFWAEKKLTATTFDEFKAALLDSRRELPVVLFCTGFNGRTPDHASQLARRMLGNLDVYVLDWSNDALRAMLDELFLKGTPAAQYSCLRGSARVYMPGVDLANPKGSSPHRYFHREDIENMRTSEFASLVAEAIEDARKASDHDPLAQKIFSVEDIARLARRR